MISLKISRVAIALLLSTLAFSGCHARMSISGDSSQFSSSSTSGVQLPSVPTTADGIAKACADYGQQRMLAPISFPSPVQACPWNVDDNMHQLNEHFQARLEQTSGFVLPAGAVICDIRFHFRSVDFRCDDHFVLAYNSLVLASSADFSSALPNLDNFLTYDWTRIKARSWNSVAQTSFCAGADRGLGSCMIPQTDTPGALSLQYSPELMNEMSALTVHDIEHAFRLITIGDNDPAMDCNHEPLDFDVEVFYVR